MGFVARVCQPSTLRMLIWPQASSAQNNTAAVSAVHEEFKRRIKTQTVRPSSWYGSLGPIGQQSLPVFYAGIVIGVRWSARRDQGNGVIIQLLVNAVGAISLLVRGLVRMSGTAANTACGRSS